MDGQEPLSTLLARKEQEVARLRDDALRALEDKVCRLLWALLLDHALASPCAHPTTSPPAPPQLRQRDEETATLQAELQSLREDFQHNLCLLDGRDAELERYEGALTAAGTEAEQKDALVTAMSQAISEAEAGERCLGLCGILVQSLLCKRCHWSASQAASPPRLPLATALVAEHEARAHTEGAMQQQRRALMQELAGAKAAAARELEQAQEVAQARCNDLQARLAAAQQQLAEEQERLGREQAQRIAQIQVRPVELQAWSGKAQESDCCLCVLNCCTGCRGALATRPAVRCLQAEEAKRVVELELRIAVLEQLGRQREEDLKVAQRELKV